jgi:lactoylglutathione lyase
MLRIENVADTLAFYCEKLGLQLLRQQEHPQGKFTLFFLATEPGAPEVELTHNWGEHSYSRGTHFGHLAYEVEDIYSLCQRLQSRGVAILRPPRDGRMAFIKDPNGISIELLQRGDALPPQEPWLSMPSTGSW